jgi:hypothetical protein
MPIRNISFVHDRPLLPIRVINPHTGNTQSLLGIVDTGADECCIPANYASLLGHNLHLGQPKDFNTGGGLATGYGHTTTIEIYDYSNQLLFSINNVLIDYMPKLHVPLLGVKHFLDRFELNVHYPKKNFSIKWPS